MEAARDHARERVTLGELAILCRNRGLAIEAELRQAGYLSSTDDFDELLRGLWAEWYEPSYLREQPSYLPELFPLPVLGQSGKDTLSQPLPDELVMRLWRMIPEIRYQPWGGFLKAIGSPSKGLSSSAALDRYGVKPLIQAQLGLGAPLPGQSRKRLLGAVWRKVRIPLVAILSPVLIPLLVPLAVVAALANKMRRRRRAEPARLRETGGQVRNGCLPLAALLAVPATAVAAWYIIWAVHLPPHGPAGRWVALILALAFGAQTAFAVGFMALGFAMDRGYDPRAPVQRRIRYFRDASVGVVQFFCIVNAPLALCLALIGVLT